MKINQSGRSMIEMLGVLAIIGVLSVGGIAGYSKAMNKYRINKITDQVSMIVANVRTLYAMQRDYVGLTTLAAKQMGVVPDEMYKNADDPISDVENGQVTNAYGGEVRIDEAGLSVSGDKKAFIITYSGLPREACVNIASGDWGSGNSSGLVAMRAANEQKFTDDVTAETGMVLNCKGSFVSGSAIACPRKDAEVKMPMPVSTAATACNCTSGNTCSITWKYY